MKASTLILVAAGAAAVYFFFMRKPAAGVPVPAAPLGYPTPPASRTPERDWREQSLDTAIKSGADLAGDLIGGLFA